MPWSEWQTGYTVVGQRRVSWVRAFTSNALAGTGVVERQDQANLQDGVDGFVDLSFGWPDGPPNFTYATYDPGFAFNNGFHQLRYDLIGAGWHAQQYLDAQGHFQGTSESQEAWLEFSVDPTYNPPLTYQGQSFLEAQGKVLGLDFQVIPGKSALYDPDAFIQFEGASMAFSSWSTDAVEFLAMDTTIYDNGSQPAGTARLVLVTGGNILYGQPNPYSPAYGPLGGGGDQFTLAELPLPIGIGTSMLDSPMIVPLPTITSQSWSLRVVDNRITSGMNTAPGAGLYPVISWARMGFWPQPIFSTPRYRYWVPELPVLATEAGPLTVNFSGT